MPTIGSLFAGVGGFDLGFERAGFTTAWQCEIDKAAQSVLRLRFPHAELFSDVREVGAHNLKPVDVLTYGSPCQNLSLAGKRAGLAGAQSGLFFEAARIIRELRERYGKPDFAIWENVPGAFSSNGGRDFAAVVQTMVDLGARDICWRVLDSQNFGVAQRRRRVFLVTDFVGERAEQVLFEPESLRGDIAPSRKARKGSAGNAAGGSGGGGGAGVMWSGTDQANAERLVDMAGTLNCNHGTPGGWIAPIAFDTMQITSPHNYSRPKPGDPCHPLAAGAHPPAIAFAQNTRDEVRLVNGDDSIVGALAAQPGMKQTSYVMQPMTLAVRGRDGGATLECRQDGLANTLLSPSGGRAGIGVGAVMAFHPTQDPISSENVTHAVSTGSKSGTASEDGCGRGVPVVATMRESGQGYWMQDQLAGTLRAEGENRPSRPSNVVSLPSTTVRRLVPAETEILQGFPQGWTAEGMDPSGKVKPQADGPRYKQMGNAVTVNVAEWIARRVHAAMTTATKDADAV